MSFGQPPRRRPQNNMPQRTPLGGVHELDPLYEHIFKQYDKVQNFVNEGDEVPTTIVRFDTPDGQGISIEAYKALMIINLGFAVHPTNPAYPNVQAFSTTIAGFSQYAAYRSRIFWDKDDSYWHIPTFTRYVINAQGVIRNAHNGQVLQVNDWGMYELVPDRHNIADKTRRISEDTIKMLSMIPLPPDFIDYGGHAYNYTLKFNQEAKCITWTKRPEVVVRDAMGLTETAANLTEFSKSYVKGKARGELAKVSEAKLYQGVVTTENMTIKLKDDSLIVAAPAPSAPAPQTVQAPQQPAPQAPAPMQTTQAPAPAPLAAPAPQAAPEVPPFETPDIPF